MRVLVESGNYFADNDNLGDRAVYQGVVRRLRRLWPACELHWITRAAGLLRATCPEATALELTEDRLPLGSAPSETLFGRLGQTLGRTGPSGDKAARQATQARRILRAVGNCDLVLATGGGYFSDSFAGHAWTVLDTLEAGVRCGKPAVILGCGLEPMGDRSLSEKMLAVVPQVSLIACREPRQSSAVARSFGANPQRIAVVGDDAIELAFDLRPKALGSALGINLRQADYSGVHAGTIERLRETLARASGKLAAPLVAIPISMRGPSDPEAIRSLLTGLAGRVAPGQGPSTPEDVIRQAGRCRLVVTGSYHAAVFALAQGIPVVALTASAHYRAKLQGLHAQFGSGCRVVALDRDGTNEALLGAIEAGWSEAERVRPELLESAQQQMEATAAAYERVRELVSTRRGARRAGPTGEGRSVTRQPARAWGQGTPPPVAEVGSSDAPPPEAALAAVPPFVLSPAEIETFRQQGFVGPFTAFRASDMQRVRQTLHERVLTTPTPYCPFGLRVRHLDSRTVYELCSAPAIVGRLQSLFGPDLVLWNSNLFNKPPAEPGRPEEYPWHQDHYNWNMEPVLNVSAWLAISAATLENGCVEVIPGSHRQIIPPVHDTDPRLSLRFGGVASDPAYVDESQKVSLPLEPGQFFLFNERLLHHSGPNRTRAHRLGLAIRVTVPLVKVSEPFPCILLSGEDRMGFNRYVERPTDEPDAEWLASLAPGRSFAFDRPIPGMGWHLLETEGSQGFAWTGLEPDAWIDFRPVGPGDHMLRIEVLHVLTPRVLDSVHVRVNGETLSLAQRRADGVLVLEARLPERVLQARPDRVRIVLAGRQLVRPCDLNPSSPDKRALGLGVRCISLTPTSDPLARIDPAPSVRAGASGPMPPAAPGKSVASLPWRAVRFVARRLLRLCLHLARRATLFPRIGNVNHYAPRRLTECRAPVPADPSIPRPTISIVTPSLNQGAFIGRTIASVLRQGYPCLEYFVQDGGSTDDTVAVLQANATRLSGWQSAADRGQAHAINLGLARTRGEVMAWLNSDDLLMPGALARVGEYFARHPEVDVLYGNRLLIDEHDMETGRWLLPGHDGNALSWGDYVPQETLFWRRALWNKVGAQIDESFDFAMDWDLLLRFRDAGARFAHLPYFLGAFRVHAGQKTSTIMESVGAEEMARIRARIWGRVPTSSELHRALVPFLLRHVVTDLAYRIGVWRAARMGWLRLKPLKASE